MSGGVILPLSSFSRCSSCPRTCTLPCKRGNELVCAYEQLCRDCKKIMLDLQTNVGRVQSASLQARDTFLSIQVIFDFFCQHFVISACRYYTCCCVQFITILFSLECCAFHPSSHMLTMSMRKCGCFVRCSCTLQPYRTHLVLEGLWGRGVLKICWDFPDR